MKCSVCNSEMEKGEVALHKTWTNFLVFSWGSTILVYKKEGEREKTKLMGIWDKNRAYRCSKCGATTIAT